MRIFIDANIIVSVFNKEYPMFTHSARVLSLADRNDFQLFTSPVCLSIAFYFAEKKCGAEKAKEKIQFFIRKVQITDTNNVVVQKALQNKKVHDFEDGIEYYSALNSKCKCIVTEDTDDFYFSEIEVLTAKDFLQQHVF